MICPVCEVETPVENERFVEHTREVWGEWCGPERSPRKCIMSGTFANTSGIEWDDD